METNGHGNDINPANIELSNNLYNDSKSTADTSNNITNTSTNNPDTNNTNTNNDTNNHTNGTSDNSTEKRPISAFSNRYCFAPIITKWLISL